MGATTIEKILARTSGKDMVRPGEIAVCRPDIVIHLDLPMTIEGAWYRPKKIFDTERVVVVFDHAIPSPTIKDASAMVEGRRFAKEFGLKHFFDVGQHGIAHVVAAEHGLTRPGELLVCADSHSCASGGLNCAGRGAGIADTLQAMTRGIVWYPVSPTIRYEFKGTLPPLVSGKDVFFHIVQTYGGHSNTSMEFGGPGIDCPGVTAIFEDGDTARVDFISGMVENVTRGKSLQGKPLAPLLAEIVIAGGVIPMLLKDGYIHAEPFAAAAS